MAKKSVSGHVDPLEVNQLRGPLLDAVMKSPGMRADLMDVAREIRTRYIAKVPKDTGDLSRSVRIKPIRSNSRDQRWNVDVTIGGVNGVDYADIIEAEYHVLSSVLRDMGYKVGDIVFGPRGKGAKDAPKPPREPVYKRVKVTSAEELSVGSVVRPGRSRYDWIVDGITEHGGVTYYRATDKGPVVGFKTRRAVARGELSTMRDISMEEEE